jgi:hypothetical protein
LAHAPGAEHHLARAFGPLDGDRLRDHIIGGILMCLTIIGIPLGLADFKLIPVSLLPMGRRIVSLEEARAMGYETTITVPDRSRG